MIERNYSIEALQELQRAQLPKFKIRYGPHERGWATDLGGAIAIIDNIPFSGPLHYLDVVKVVIQKGKIPTAGKVVWRAYPCRAALRYPNNETKRRYAELHEAFTSKRWAVEGCVAGLCMVCFPAGVDLADELRTTGLECDILEMDCDG